MSIFCKNQTVATNLLYERSSYFLGGGLGSLAAFWPFDRYSELRQENLPLPVPRRDTRLQPSRLLARVSLRLPRWQNHAILGCLLATGFLGGFTTFSTFAKDTHSLWTTGLTHLAIAKIIFSVVLGILAVILGLKLTHP